MIIKCLTISVVVSALIGLGGASVQAAASQAAICAVEQAIVCAPFEACQRALPRSINLPVLLKIDRSAGVVLSRRESGEERSSKIGAESGDDTFHILQGIDVGSPWSIRFDIKTGRFSLTSAQPVAGFVAFGICSSKLLK